MADPTKCPRRHCGARLRFLTNGFGATIAVCDPCERNRAGYCRDCTARIEQTPGAPLRMRCRVCRLRVSAERRRERYQAPDSPSKATYDAYRRRPEVRAKQAERNRQAVAADPERRRKHLRDQYAKHREQRLAYRRRQYRRARARILAALRAEYAANRTRILAERRATLAAHRQRFGHFPDHCQQCGAVLPYSGRGGRKKWCAAHRPYRARTGARTGARTQRLAA